MNNKVRVALIVFLSLVAVYCGAKVFSYSYDGYENAKVNEEIRKEYYEGIADPKDLAAENRIKKFERLKEINEDIVGWLKVGGTKIDYPVVKSIDNDRYLRRNIKREWTVRGSIFMDYRSDENIDEYNTVIYGHNMKDGSMFGDLIKYKDDSFYTEHPYIEYNCPTSKTKWLIFSAYIYKPEDDTFKTNFDSREEFWGYLVEVANKSIYDTGVTVKKEDRIITLMTCTYEYNDARFVVHGKLVEIDE